MDCVLSGAKRWQVQASTIYMARYHEGSVRNGFSFVILVFTDVVLIFFPIGWHLRLMLQYTR